MTATFGRFLNQTRLSIFSTLAKRFIGMFPESNCTNVKASNYLIGVAARALRLQADRDQSDVRLNGTATFAEAPGRRLISLTDSD